MDKNIGRYSFIAGVVIAIVLGLTLPINDTVATWLTSVLVIMGLVVGFLNITHSETKEFLTLATILVVIAYAGGVGYNGMENRAVVGGYLAGILNSILVFVVPAAVVVAL